MPSFWSSITSTISTGNRFASTNSACSPTSKAATKNGQEMVQITKSSPSSSPLSSSVYQQESVDATILVDELLQYTRSLMNGAQHHMIAYSGGIDSSLVAALVHKSASTSSSNSGSEETVQAVLGLSPAVPSEQVVLAEQVASFIGISLEQIPTTEGTDAIYIENSGQACLACKTHLYTCLNAIMEHHEGDTTKGAITGLTRRLYNGTNADDLNDPTRLGLIAADRFDVRSPLERTPKALVRIAGRHLGLPNWNHAASPCLRSRLALGVEAIPQHLQRIERAERFVRQRLDLDATHNLRVRLLSQNRAMVEVDELVLDSAKASLKDENESLWQTYFEDKLGFASVDVRCFKSGSVAPTIASSSNTENRERISPTANDSNNERRKSRAETSILG